MKPQVFGQYVLLDVLGSGGTGEVFLAKTAKHGVERLVALKRVRKHLAGHVGTMFADEAGIMAAQHHGAIPRVYDTGAVDGYDYIAMEYVHGRDIRTIFNHYSRQRKIIPLRQACYIGAQLCAGLEHAHNSRDFVGRPLDLVHRDLSPENVLLSFNGELKIIDFGSAKASVRREELAHKVGHLTYMSPEQIDGRDLDRRSDIFAIGIILFELFTGERLFLGAFPQDTIMRLRECDIPELRDYNEEIPEALEAVVLRALARNPDERYQTAGEFLEALERVIAQEDLGLSSTQLSHWFFDLYGEEARREAARMAELWQEAEEYVEEIVLRAAS